MIEINLLPESMRKKRGGLRLPRELVLPVGFLGAIILIVLAVTIMQKMTLRSLEKRMEVVRAESLQYSKELEEIRGYESLKGQLQRRVEIAATLDWRRKLWVQILEDLNIRLPNYVWLTLVDAGQAKRRAPQGEVETVSPTAVIRGYAFTLSGLATFLERLKSSPFLKEVEFSYFKIEELEGRRDVYSFELKGSLPSTAGEMPPTHG
ncbi:MAG: hypothetical protein E3J45_06700 [Candidatus Zixiibacteriota bacterium]|nr:MAG: hypothetical protein E3J45_06700 [candidate division Zixibacteria bacterium]